MREALLKVRVKHHYKLSQFSYIYLHSEHGTSFLGIVKVFCGEYL